MLNIDIKGGRYLVLPVKLRSHLDEPPDDGGVTEEGGMEERRLLVRVHGVDLHVLQGVQQEVHHLRAVVPGGAHQQRVLCLDKSSPRSRHDLRLTKYEFYDIFRMS